MRVELSVHCTQESAAAECTMVTVLYGMKCLQRQMVSEMVLALSRIMSAREFTRYLGGSRTCTLDNILASIGLWQTSIEGTMTLSLREWSGSRFRFRRGTVVIIYIYISIRLEYNHNRRRYY